MKHSSIRRFVVTAIAATGVIGVVGVGPASAQDSTCVVSHTTGTPENRQPNFQARADRAEFEFPALMRSLAEEVVLMAPGQPDLKEGRAIIKATVSRQGDGPLTAEKMEVQWPLTAVKDGDKRHGVIALSHQQNVPVGIIMTVGLEEIGSIVFEAGKVDPQTRVIDFNREVSALIHQSLMRQHGFSMRLVSGGASFSTVQPETYAYVGFINDTLTPAMNAARRKVAEGACKSD